MSPSNDPHLGCEGRVTCLSSLALPAPRCSSRCRTHPRWATIDRSLRPAERRSGRSLQSGHRVSMDERLVLQLELSLGLMTEAVGELHV